MIGTRRELLDAIRKTLDQATPEEKLLLRDELLQVLQEPPTSFDQEFLRSLGIAWDEPNEAAQHIHGLTQAFRQIRAEESQLKLFRKEDKP
jgi:hypothetical protein